MHKQPEHEKSCKKTKTVELCAVCAAKRMAELLPAGLTLRKVEGGVNHKITSRDCQRRRYSGRYETRRAGA